MIQTPIIPTIGMTTLEKASDMQLAAALGALYPAGKSLLGATLLQKRLEYESLRLMARETLSKAGKLEIPTTPQHAPSAVQAGDMTLD